MVTREQIMRFCDGIVREYKPDRIILFGSYAYGRPHESSDVDILVIMRFNGSEIAKAGEILSTLLPKFPLDLMVQSPERVKQRLEWEDWFLREVVEKGTVVYEAPHARVA